MNPDDEQTTDTSADDVQRETEAMRAVVAIVGPLPMEAQKRVLRWAAGWLGFLL